jgi:hypothetical protein
MVDASHSDDFPRPLTAREAESSCIARRQPSYRHRDKGYRHCRVGAVVAWLRGRRDGRVAGRTRTAADRRDADGVRVVRLGPLLRRGRDRGPDDRHPERCGHRRAVCVAEGLHRPARRVRGRGCRPSGKRCAHDRPEISHVSGTGRHRVSLGPRTVKWRRMGARPGGGMHGLRVGRLRLAVRSRGLHCQSDPLDVPTAGRPDPDAATAATMKMARSGIRHRAGPALLT